MFIAFSFPLSSLTKPSHIRELVGRWTDLEDGNGGRWGGLRQLYGPHFTLSSDLTYCTYIKHRIQFHSQHVHHNPHTHGTKSHLLI